MSEIKHLYKRTIEQKIHQVSATFPVVLITGPRQTGKTTVLRQCIQSENINRRYVSLDDMQLRSLAQTDPQLFLATYKPPILIDEVQYAPQLFPYIKIIADEQNRSGLFWLTGSQQFSMMQNVTESLAGRVGILRLFGLSQSEINDHPETKPFLPINADPTLNDDNSAADILTLYSHILRGSYPALYANPDTDTGIFYSSYIQTYIERDIQTIINISDKRSFTEVLRVLAARTGQMLNCNDIAKEVGISSNTVKKWISILESSGIIYLLPSWSKNVGQRAVKTPKLYFTDTGLCCRLTGWQTPESLSEGIMNGAILETYVITEILKSFTSNGIEPNLYYYRDKDKKEIDLIIEHDGMIYPIEIKRSAAPNLSMTKHFSVFNDLSNVSNGAVICLYPNILPLSRDVISIPVWNI